MICAKCREYRHRKVGKMLAHMKTCPDPKWKAVVEARLKGDTERAERLAKKAMGIKGEPMSDETKEQLRRWREEHKDEIKERAQQKRAIRKRAKQLLKAGSARLRRKR